MDLESLEEEWLMCQRVMWGEHVSFEDYWEAYDRSREIELQMNADSAAGNQT